MKNKDFVDGAEQKYRDIFQRCIKNFKTDEKIYNFFQKNLEIFEIYIVYLSIGGCPLVQSSLKKIIFFHHL
jgi:hypothetical protein